MRFSFSVFLLFSFLTYTNAEPLGEQIVIPAVQNAISQQLSRFSKYTSYSGTATVASLPTSQIIQSVKAAETPEVRLAQAVAAPAAASTSFPYWYESIAHQGKAAFNTNTSYVVYRNVKSYGAKGYYIPS